MGDASQHPPRRYVRPIGVIGPGWSDWRWALRCLAPLALLVGCSGTAGTFLPGSASQNLNTNDQPLARPKYVASIAASAKRCGFERGPEAIKAAYLAFEAKQGVSKEELGKLEEVYNLTWKSTYDQIGSNPTFCSEKKLAEIRVALRHQDASDYTPNFVPVEVNAPRPRVEEPFDPKKFWDDKNADGSNQP
jgi:hypothetical protein